MLDQNDLQAIEKLISAATQQAVRDAVSQAVAYSEGAVETRLDAIKEGLDLALERPRVEPERVDRLEEDVAAVKLVVREHSREIEKLKKAQ